MKPPLDDGFRHLTNFLADTELDLEALDSCMKTTPDGLTHLINMLVDVANLQRRASGTPGARCDVELDFAEVVGKVAVKVLADVDVAAPPPTTFSAENNRPLTPADVEAAADALEATDYRDHATTSMVAVERVLRAAGCQLPDRGAVG